jgi:hypothetical protein
MKMSPVFTLALASAFSLQFANVHWPEIMEKAAVTDTAKD